MREHAPFSEAFYSLLRAELRHNGEESDQMAVAGSAQLPHNHVHGRAGAPANSAVFR